jgi:endonuclease/exonuclease/phosphatase family metal-dependent hydrolase
MKRNLFLLLSLSAIVTACAGGKSNESTVKVMSFNIRLGSANDGDNSWQNRRDGAVKMIETNDPDIIGLQEAMTMQNEYLAEKLPQYTQLGVGRDDGKNKGEFMRVLYKTERYDALDDGNFWLSETPDEVSRGWDGACNRMVTWVKLREKGTKREFYFFNTHLDHQGEEARREGVKLLIRKIGEIAGDKATFFVTGDFNADPTDAVMQPMFATYTSARDTAPDTDHHGTFNSWGRATNSVPIDYIFSHNATPTLYHTVTEEYGVPFVSDHFPIVAEYKY